jgi:hypothetical protein
MVGSVSGLPYIVYLLIRCKSIALIIFVVGVTLEEPISEVRAIGKGRLPPSAYISRKPACFPVL